MIIAYARKHNKTFGAALSYLLTKKKSLSKSSIAVQHLNFHDATARGDDLKFSLLSLGEYTKNPYQYNLELKNLLNAKSDKDLVKKITNFEFDNPLMLVLCNGCTI